MAVDVSGRHPHEGFGTETEPMVGVFVIVGLGLAAIIALVVWALLTT